MTLLADITPVTALFIGALLLTTWMLLTRSHRYFTRSKERQSSLAPTSEPVREERGRHLDAPAAMARWEVQMHDTAREASAQLDSKMSALEALIADADRAAARLEAALARASKAGLGAEQPGAQPTSQAESAGGAGILPVQRPGTGQPPVAPVERGPEDRRQEIYTLADYGFEPAEIARRVGSPIGEVQLILGLREEK